jgi:hypothetical protein
VCGGRGSPPKGIADRFHFSTAVRDVALQLCSPPLLGRPSLSLAKSARFRWQGSNSDADRPALFAAAPPNLRDDGGEPVQITKGSSKIIRHATAEVSATHSTRSSTPRDGTKLARVLELLQRDCGATLAELTDPWRGKLRKCRAILWRRKSRRFARTTWWS